MRFLVTATVDGQDVRAMVDWPSQAPFDSTATVRVHSSTLGFAFEGVIEEYFVPLVDQSNLPANYTHPAAELRLKNAARVQ